MRGERFAQESGAGWGQVGITALLLLGLFYVGQNTLTGRHGFLALIENRQQISVLQDELAEVATERARIQRDVALLSPPYVDQDLLDERARAELGYAREGELVIFPNQDN